MSDAEALVDTVLAAFFAKLLAGYATWPKKLVGAHVYFVVDAGGERVSRTLRCEADKPRLFRGVEAPGTNPAFISFLLTIPQLYKLMTSTDASTDIVADGNEPALLQAVAAALSAAGR